MARTGFFSYQIVVKDDERAFLTRNGRFVELLGPSKFTRFDPRSELAAEVVKVVRADVPPD